jgi:Ribosomal protein S1
MSEEILETEVTQETPVQNEVTQEPVQNEVPVETMADHEEHIDDANPWNLVTTYMNQNAVLTVNISGIVNGGAIATLEGLRGFIPASKLSTSYIENLETYLSQDIDVQVIDVDQANNRLVLSARELLKKKEKQEQSAKISSIEVGSVLTGTVDSLQTYGAFVRLENGLSGLVHISQISPQRIKAPSDVLKAKQEVNVKVIGIKDGKISLSIKALLPGGDTQEEEPAFNRADLPKSEALGTSLGDLFKNIKL